MIIRLAAAVLLSASVAAVPSSHTARYPVPVSMNVRCRTTPGQVRTVNIKFLRAI